MRISLQPVGTRGDVEPMVALAQRLRARGHHVSFGAPDEHRERIEAAGFDFHVVGLDMQARLDRLKLESVSKLRAMIMTRDLVVESAERQIDEALAAGEGADLIIGAGTGFGGFHAAERRGVPYGFVFYAPGWLPSAHHAPAVMPFRGLPRFLNRLLWRLLHAQGDRLLLKPVNAARRRLGLRELPTLVGTAAEHALLAYDPIFGPPPDDMRRVLPGWPQMVLTQAGALVEGEDQSLSTELEAFCSTEPAPVFVGFGSMVDSNPRQMARMLEDLAERLDLRIIWALGWTLDQELETGPRVLKIREAPFRALFPRCRLIVHHGGAGTTATALRAGVPQLVVPHIADQFFFGDRVASLGLGPQPIPRRRLDARRFERALRELTDGERTWIATAADVRLRLPSDPLETASRWVEGLELPRALEPARGL